MMSSQDKVQGGGDGLLFSDKPKISAVKDSPVKEEKDRAWKVMVVDDDDVVHQVTLMVLADYTFQGRPVEIIQGYSGAACRELLQEHPDTAVLLLDVVMETDSAGLDTAKYIREKLKNQYVRIILRTGQPGQAPEKEVISQYDINDYKEKTDLTIQKLYTSITVALRAYSDLKKIENLVLSNTDLEHRVRERTREIMKINQELQSEILKRKKAFKSLAKSEARLSEAQHIARIGNWEWDIPSNEISCSDLINQILGIDIDSPIKTYQDIIKFVAEGDKAQVKKAFEQSMETHQPYDIEHRMVRFDGQLLHVHQQGQIELDDDGQALRIAGTLQDITTRRLAEEEMRKLSGAVEQIADAVMITDIEGVVEYVNPAFETMTGYSKDEIIGKTPRLLKSDKQSEAFYKRLWKTILDGGVFSDVIINRKKSGEIYYEEKNITPQKDHHGSTKHFISTGKDVTERIEAQERLYHLAHHDSLTGLPNRVLLQDRLGQAIARIRWHERKIAVMFLDLDRFKTINDTLGHAVGDQVLQYVARQLEACLREGDTIARLGGDEFAIVLNDIASQEDIPPIAQKIIASLAKPMEINNHELFITSSIGISIFPQDGKDSQTLLKKADMAMYRAKAQGKDNYQHYNAEDDNQSSERLSMETYLRRALEKNEFTLNYQPQLSVRDGSIIGFEALLRWYNSELKNVSPMHFIPILEETGMISQVGDWVLQTACRQAKDWLDTGMMSGRVAVNLSIRQFKEKGLVKRIDEILSETGLSPNHLELEITEGLLIDQISETAKILNELNEMGICLSIDDFGTGYSSMNYLKRLPFNTLKIDYIFVRDVTFNLDDAAITSAIITLAHNLGMQVVAEGVETMEQLEYLREQRCDAIQGYLYSPPLTVDAVIPLIKEQSGPKIIQLAG